MKVMKSVILAACGAATFWAGFPAATAAQAPAMVEALVSEPTAEATIAAWQEDPARIFAAGDVALSDLLYLARPVVVFADTPRDPAFSQQMALLQDRIEDLAVRDVIVLVDTDPGAESALREVLRPRGFALTLIDKDGRIAQRKPSPWSVREITHAIDKMPLRQQEINEAR
ncbi:uncharacterized protein DUF4174 [Pseudoroseicyclus aestuarii]|uniref:Uncharacterized protein DUF4174 n=2 Tax=Pseudoroseicyclus aestuarii TaxID=1795041 RepID=A0A318SV37_9RHOB|nr:uncharacterized protein DUF4174 [Pseudoroseicyclus aestuarii]